MNFTETCNAIAKELGGNYLPYTLFDNDGSWGVYFHGELVESTPQFTFGLDRETKKRLVVNAVHYHLYHLTADGLRHGGTLPGCDRIEITVSLDKTPAQIAKEVLRRAITPWLPTHTKAWAQKVENNAWQAARLERMKSIGITRDFESDRHYLFGCKIETKFIGPDTITVNAELNYEQFAKLLEMLK